VSYWAPFAYDIEYSKKQVINMPGVVGSISIGNVFNGGVSGFGDVAVITPKTSLQTVTGAGAFNTGKAISVTDPLSNNLLFDIDAVNQPIAGNL
jgi:spore germination protein PF